MHEAQLFQDLHRKLEEIARSEAPAEISRVSIWVGALCHVSEATLRSHWAAIVEGSGAKNAALEVMVSSDVSDPRARDLIVTHVALIDPGDRAAPVPDSPRRAHEGR